MLKAKQSMEAEINKKQKFTFFKTLMNTQNLMHHKKQLAKYNKLHRSFTDLSHSSSMKTFNIYNPSMVCKKNSIHNTTFRILKQGQFQKQIKSFRERQQRNSKMLDKLIAISDSSPDFDKLVRRSPDLHKISINQINFKYRSIDRKNMEIGKSIIQVKSNYSLRNLNRNRYYSTVLQKRKLNLNTSKNNFEDDRSCTFNLANMQAQSFFTSYENQEDLQQIPINEKINQIIKKSQKCLQSFKSSNIEFNQKKSKIKNHVQMSQKLRKQKLAVSLIKSRKHKQTLVSSKIIAR